MSWREEEKTQELKESSENKLIVFVTERYQTDRRMFEVKGHANTRQTD